MKKFFFILIILLSGIFLDAQYIYHPGYYKYIENYQKEDETENEDQAQGDTLFILNVTKLQ